MWIHNLVPFVIPVLRAFGTELMWYAQQLGSAYGAIGF